MNRRWIARARAKGKGTIKVPVFKVLNSYGTATYSGVDWPLPEDGSRKPGAWMECGSGPLRMCRNGLHLSHDPFAWDGDDPFNVIYLVEYEYAKSMLIGFNRYRSKFCVRRARLLRRVTRDEARRLMKRRYRRSK